MVDSPLCLPTEFTGCSEPHPDLSMLRLTATAPQEDRLTSCLPADAGTPPAFSQLRPPVEDSMHTSMRTHGDDGFHEHPSQEQGSVIGDMVSIGCPVPFPLIAQSSLTQSLDAKEPNSSDTPLSGACLSTTTTMRVGTCPSNPTVSQQSDARISQTPVALLPAQGDGTLKLSDHSPLPRQLNEHELRLVPDPHSVVDDQLLKCTPFIVNTKYLVLICADCRRSVKPDGASKHLRQIHPHCRPGADFNTSVIARFPGLVADVAHPTEVVEAIFGLAIPIEEYTICARCRRGYLNQATWRRHRCPNADDNLEGCPEHFLSLVQTFFGPPKLHYFPVKLPVSQMDEPVPFRDACELIQSAYRDLSSSEDAIEEPEDYRELNQFLLKEGWIKHVYGYSRTELFLLTALPTEGDPLKLLPSHVVALMSEIQATIGRGGYHVRRLLGKRPR